MPFEVKRRVFSLLLFRLFFLGRFQFLGLRLPVRILAPFRRRTALQSQGPRGIGRLLAGVNGLDGRAAPSAPAVVSSSVTATTTESTARPLYLASLLATW